MRALLDFYAGKVTRWSSRLLAIRVQKPDGFRLLLNVAA